MSFLAFFHPSTAFLSLFSSNTAKPVRLLQLSSSSILRLDQHQPATGQGYIQSHFQFHPHAKGQLAFLPVMGATVDSSIDSLLPAVRFPCPSTVFSLAQRISQERIFTWKSLQLRETFPHAHVLARDLLLHNCTQRLECGDVSTFHDQTQSLPLLKGSIGSDSINLWSLIYCFGEKLCCQMLMMPGCLAKEICCISALLLSAS